MTYLWYDLVDRFETSCVPFNVVRWAPAMHLASNVCRYGLIDKLKGKEQPQSEICERSKTDWGIN